MVSIPLLAVMARVVLLSSVVILGTLGERYGFRRHSQGAADDLPPWPEEESRESRARLEPASYLPVYIALHNFRNRGRTDVHLRNNLVGRVRQTFVAPRRRAG